MIKNNFNLLMAERQMKITRISNDTGISRTTLTALSQETNKGVQLDTLNTLCNYFNITPCDFFDYIPYEFSCELIENDMNQEDEMIYDGDLIYKFYDLFINVYNNKNEKMYTFSQFCTLISHDSMYLVNNEPEFKTVGLLKIENKTEDKETFLSFIKENMTVQWQQHILVYLEYQIFGKLNGMVNDVFDEFGIKNDLKKLI